MANIGNTDNVQEALDPMLLWATPLVSLSQEEEWEVVKAFATLLLLNLVLNQDPLVQGIAANELRKSASNSSKNNAPFIKCL
ncbi:hypothetical protein PFLUV_G00150590 [Perca fluviatilis]|uniref:Uncharacterized protein n=1 Tax=Perca fluviatilis TaxID=8168 RepID=A0A6A5EV34_PERFL|nr:hypothetical protein PFLUV_G00150590 [Perca fluviatilis]